MPKPAEIRLLIKRLLAHGAGEMAGLVNDPPVDLIRHLLVAFVFQIGERGSLRMAHGLLQGLEPHGTKKSRIAHIFHHPTTLHLTTLELPIGWRRIVSLDLESDNHKRYPCEPIAVLQMRRITMRSLLSPVEIDVLEQFQLHRHVSNALLLQFTFCSRPTREEEEA